MRTIVFQEKATVYKLAQSVEKQFLQNSNQLDKCRDRAMHLLGWSQILFDW